MVQGKTIDEKKAQAPYSSEDTTSLGMVSPTGSEENNPPLDLRIDIAFKVVFGEKEFMIDREPAPEVEQHSGECRFPGGGKG